MIFKATVLPRRPVPRIGFSRLLGIATSLLALAAGAEVIDIDNTRLASLAAKGVPLIDIRTAGEWSSTGIIAGSKLLTFFDEKGQANPPQWLETAKAIANPGQPLILVCRSGKRSRAASQFLSDQAGYKTVYNVSGGINGWLGENRPLVPASGTKTCAMGARC